MLRDELEFKMRMRASLRGIVQLDPESVTGRLIDLDAEIRALEASVGLLPTQREMPCEATLRAA